MIVGSKDFDMNFVLHNYKDDSKIDEYARSLLPPHLQGNKTVLNNQIMYMLNELCGEATVGVELRNELIMYLSRPFSGYMNLGTELTEKEIELHLSKYKGDI